MGPILSSLIDLQGVEGELRTAQKKLKKIQQVVLKQQYQIKQLEDALTAKRGEVKLTRMQHDKLELELRSQEDEITKYRVALNQARTNKDYSSILTRINTKKADKSKLEDQILSLMTQIETDQAASKELELNIEKENVRLEEIHQQAEEKQKDVQRELDALLQQRQDAFRQVPGEQRSLFDRLAERYDGEVLAKVERSEKRKAEQTCGGCYMSILLEIVNSLMSRDDVMTCTNCGRILVLDMHPKQQPTTK
jgi:predicted  nucleic acid-binding Zn-ribbon protein